MYQNPYLYQNPYGNTQQYQSPYGNMMNNQQVPFQQQPQAPIPNMQPQMQSNIEYVSGIEGAKALILPPNTQRLVLDSDNKYFYIKSTDMQGKPTLRRFKYSDVEENAPTEKVSLPEYVPLADFNSLLEEFDSLKKEFEKLKKTDVKENKSK